MDYIEAVAKVAKDLNLDIKIVNLAYRSYWKYIKKEIANLPLKENITEDDFNKLNTSFNVPSLGKLYCKYKKVIAINKYCKELKDKKQNENKED